MKKENNIMKTPKITHGEVVEIFACGGQCRGQNHVMYTADESKKPKIKAG